MEIRKEVTRDNILSRVSEYDVFKTYNSNFQKLGQAFCSELREDRNPTCYINKYGDRLFYRDFGTEKETIDCFGYIMKKYGVSFQESLEMINLDFNLKLLPVISISHRKNTPIRTNIKLEEIVKMPTEIRVQTRAWTIYDKAYWFDKYGITSKELKYFKVFPLSGFWINASYFKCRNNSYGYYFGIAEDSRQLWKIYQPNNNKKDLKWMTNASETVFQGYDQIPWMGDYLIITKSLKDVIILYKLGIPAIAPQGENMHISPEFISLLKRRFKHLLLIYDNDAPGITAGNRLAEEHDLDLLFLPEGTKDPSDFVELYGLEGLQQFLKESWKHLK